MVRERLTDEAFLVMWVRAWREGKSLTELSMGGIPYHALVNRHRALMLLGVPLPALAGMSGAQPKTVARADKLKKLLAELMGAPVL